LDVAVVAAPSGEGVDLKLAEFEGLGCTATCYEDDGHNEPALDGIPLRAALSGFDLVWFEDSVLELPDRPSIVAIVASAVAFGVPVFAPRERFVTPAGLRTRVGPTPADATAAVRDTSEPKTPSGGLDQLQRHYARMAAIRDYGTDRPQDTLLLLNEELGELAHALRTAIGLERSHLSRNLKVAEELADVQLYVLHLANITGTSLGRAVREKEVLNHRRWQAKYPTVLGERTPHYLAIEGIIGCGKSTVAGICAGRLGVAPTLERVAEHPFLERFYTDPERYAVEVELTFILMRWHELRDQLASLRVIADFAPYKDLLFSEILLSGFDLDLVHHLYDHFWQSAPRPTIAVFLDVTPEVALERIQKRGRAFELGIDIAYLEALRAVYHRNLKNLGQHVVALSVRAEWSPERVADEILAVAQEHGFG